MYLDSDILYKCVACGMLSYEIFVYAYDCDVIDRGGLLEMNIWVSFRLTGLRVLGFG